MSSAGAVELATAYVALVPSAKGIAAGLAAELGSPVEKAAADSAEKAGGSFASSFQNAGKVAAIGLTAGIGGLAAVGGALFKIGADFDDAFDKIRTQTGATGAKLDGLKGDFRGVFASVPTDMDSASTAIAGVNQKLGLTGAPLQEVSKQVLELSRVTGTDLKGNIDATTGVLNNWGVAAKDQGRRLDELFRASQATGVSVADLSGTMSKSGSVFRQVGFSFEDSAAVLGLLSKAGVDAGAVMPSLSKAVAAAAKDGKSAGDVFRSTFDAIRKAPTDTAAAGAAIDVFGAKAGPNLAGLIRQGKLSYEELSRSIANGHETITGAAADTNDFHEKFQILMNKSLLLIEPLATRVFSGLSSGIDAVSRVIGNLVTGWNSWNVVMTDGGKSLGPVAETFRTIHQALIALVGAFHDGDVTSDGFVGKMEQLGVIIRRVTDFLGDHKVILVGVGVALLAVAAPVPVVIAALVALYEHFDIVRTVVDTVAKGVVESVQFIATEVTAFVAYWQSIWPQVSEAVGHVMIAVRDIVTPILLALQFLWHAVGDDILSLVMRVFNTMQGVIDGVMNVIRGIIQTVLALINGDWGRAWDGIRLIIAGVWDVIYALIAGALGEIKSILGAAASVISGTLRNAFDGIGHFVADTFNGVVSTIGGFGGRIASAARGMFDGIKEAFRAAINWIIRAWNGLEFTIPAVDTHIPGIGKIGGFTLDAPNIPFLAAGGTALAPGLAVVGENGPELAFMNRGATIQPLPASGPAAGPSVYIENVNLQASPGVNGAQVGEELVRYIKAYMSSGGGRGWLQEAAG
jgi:TP901 family phage tail tape measure protein